MSKHQWKCSLACLLVPAMLLAGCSRSQADVEKAVQGRWHRTAQSTTVVADPFETLAGEYYEFRPGGVLAGLLFDPGTQTFWTATTGTYSVTSADQIVIQGKCWQGFQSYDCSSTYRLDIQGDSLVISDEAHDERTVTYERVGAADADLPPTLAPPMPSPTPAGG